MIVSYIWPPFQIGPADSKLPNFSGNPRNFRAGIPGLEPRMTVPETVVLPITPYPKGYHSQRARRPSGGEPRSDTTGRPEPAQIGSSLRLPQLAAELEDGRPVLLLDDVGGVVVAALAGDLRTLDGPGHGVVVDLDDRALGHALAPLPGDAAPLAQSHQAPPSSRPSRASASATDFRVRRVCSIPRRLREGKPSASTSSRCGAAYIE